MIVCVHRTAAATARAAARVIADIVRRNPAAVVGLPTGRTSAPIYAALVRLHRQGRVSFRRATTFNLDELCGLEPDDPRGFHAFLRRHFYSRVDLHASRVHRLRGTRGTWRAEAAAYEDAIARAGGLDLCILGLGRNGHVAFNEPAARLRRRTHLTGLTAGTRRDNAAAFERRAQAVPTHAITVGMGAILGAKHVLLVAMGRSKAEIIRRALRGPATPRVPASLLQRHPSVTVLLDRSAAARWLTSDRGRRRRPRAASAR